MTIADCGRKTSHILVSAQDTNEWWDWRFGRFTTGNEPSDLLAELRLEPQSISMYSVNLLDYFGSEFKKLEKRDNVPFNNWSAA
jgi:hypothetical protein